MRDYLWVIEENTRGFGWLPWETRRTREQARRLQHFLQDQDRDFKGRTRVVKYVRDPWSMRHPKYF